MLRFLLLLLLATTLHAQDRKQIRAVRVADGSRLQLDGKLDEALWATAPVMTGFVQRQPNEGAAASEETEVRIAWDDVSLWIGARMHAADAAKIAAPVTRRDNVTQSEHLLVSLDTFLDRRTAYTFGVTAAGTRVDRYQPFDSESRVETFDPVWEAAVARDASGWTAELRIPFSQLRFHDHAEQTWGINVRRTIPTRNEHDYWIVVPRKEVGWASRFGDLTGIQVRPTRRAEVLPYVAASSRLRGETDPQNPLDESQRFNRNIGADIKAGIGPNLTLDAALNPDFGQVEADPAVVNLSAFETVYPERRPFFIEGSRLLTGGGRNWFYSRRIGAAPSGTVLANVDADYVEAPLSTGILGAAKLTGRFPTGTSVGALFAVTDSELARTSAGIGSEIGYQRVVPRAMYGVFRGEQQFGASGSTVGLSVTGVNRSLDAQLAPYLNERAFAGGTDWNLRFKQGEYEFGGYAGFSHIAGDAAAIARAQRAPARYYQRPDAGHVEFDPMRTSLSGYTAGARVEKLGGKHWLWMASVDAASPGFELNDAGQLSRADNIFAFGQIRYRETEPRGVVRDYEIGFNSENSFNFDGVNTFAAIRSDSFVTWKNFWTTTFTAWMDLPAYDDRATRGGPLVRTARAWVNMLTVANSTSSRHTWNATVYRGENEYGERTWELYGTVAVRPTPRWQLSVRPAYFQTTNPRLWFTTRGSRYIFSFIDQDQVSLRLRADFAVTPDLTFELYAEPFAASGRYYNFGELPRPRSGDLRFYDTRRRDDGAIVVNEPTETFTLPNRDFNIRSFRSNAVARWEWRPGSTMYLVWQQDRFADLAPGTARFSSLGQSLSATGDNILALKISYWLPF
ncbi:MAG TPA: DUF5916 domain-containing protein [Thermoanaerobaculia bacterium]